MLSIKNGHISNKICRKVASKALKFGRKIIQSDEKIYCSHFFPALGKNDHRIHCQLLEIFHFRFDDYFYIIVKNLQRCYEISFVHVVNADQLRVIIIICARLFRHRF